MRTEAGRSHERMPPLKLLCGQLGMSIRKNKEKEQIKVNRDTVSKIRRELGEFRKSKKLIDKAINCDILCKLKEQETVCKRLDNVTFEIIVAVLLQAEYSAEKELCLLHLTTSLYDKTDHLEARKIHLCSTLMLQLLQCFINKNENNKVRRWVGIFLRELIDDNEKNREIFLMSPEDTRRKLGSIFIFKDNEIIRVICSHLLKASKFEHADIFFPVGFDPSLIAQFPDPYQAIREWDTSFQQFMDSYLTATPSVQSEDVIVFAHQMETNLPVKFAPYHHINMLLEHHGGISIYQSRIKGNSDEFIDMPLEKISQITRIEDVLKKANRETLFSFTLVLREHSKFISTHNGISAELKSIGIFNFAESEAKFQRKHLMAMCQRLRSLASWSQSSGSPIVVNHGTRNEASSIPAGSSRITSPKYSGIPNRRSRLLLNDSGKRPSTIIQSQSSLESKQNSSKGVLTDDLREKISHFVTTSPAKTPEELNKTLEVEYYFTGFQGQLGFEDRNRLDLNDIGQQNPMDLAAMRKASRPSKSHSKPFKEASTEVNDVLADEELRATMERPTRMESASIFEEHHRKSQPERNNSTETQYLDLVESLDGHINVPIPKHIKSTTSRTFKNNEVDNYDLTDPPNPVLAKKAARVANTANDRIILQRPKKQPLKAKKPLKMGSFSRVQGTQSASVPATKVLQSSFPNSSNPTLSGLNRSTKGTPPKENSLSEAHRDLNRVGLSPARKIEATNSAATPLTNKSKSNRRMSLSPVLKRSGLLKRSRKKAAKLTSSRIVELVSGEQETADEITPVVPMVKKDSGTRSTQAKTKISHIAEIKRDSEGNDPNAFPKLPGASQETNYKEVLDFPMEDFYSKHIMSFDPLDDLDINQIFPDDDEIHNLQKDDARRLRVSNDGKNFENFERQISGSKEAPPQFVKRLAERLSSVLEDIEDISKSDAKFTRLKGSVVDGPSFPKQIPGGVRHFHASSSPRFAQLPVRIRSRDTPLKNCANGAEIIAPKGTVGSDLEDFHSSSNGGSVVPTAWATYGKEQMDEVKGQLSNYKRRLAPSDASAPSLSSRRSPRILAQKKNNLSRSAKGTFQGRSRPQASSSRSNETLTKGNASKPNAFVTDSNEDKKLATKISGILHPSGSDFNLVNEHQYRKPHLISYGIKGPRNQGVSSPVDLSSVLNMKSMREFIHSQNPTKFHVPARRNNRRACEARDVHQDKQYADQKNLTVKRSKAENHPVVGATGSTNSLPIPIPTYGSQGSRVDENGSPLPWLSSTEPHSSLNRIINKDFGHVEIASFGAQKPDGYDDSDCDQIGDDHLVEIAPEEQCAVMIKRVQQVEGTKNLPSSLQMVKDVVPRNVFHQMTLDDNLGSAKPKAALNRKTEMLDPFIENTLEPPMSDFAKRLKMITQDSTVLQTKVAVNEKTVPLVAVVSEDPEKTLVNVENESLAPRLNFLRKESSTSSSESGDDYTPSPLQIYQITPEEQWRNALKPHQRNVIDSLRQITNSLVQHLIDQEEAIEDVVEDYQRNGAKLVNHTVNKVTERRKRAYDEIEGLKIRLMTDYRESRRRVLDTRSELKAAPVKDLEKKLVAQSDIVFKMIAAAKCRTV